MLNWLTEIYQKYKQYTISVLSYRDIFAIKSRSTSIDIEN